MSDGRTTTRPLHAIEDERLHVIRMIERLHVMLREVRNKQDAKRERAKLLESLEAHTKALRDVNAELKTKRREMTALLERGQSRPRTALQYVGALYHAFRDAVPEQQWTPAERALMRRTRDWILAGGTDGRG